MPPPPWQRAFRKLRARSGVFQPVALASDEDASALGRELVRLRLRRLVSPGKTDPLVRLAGPGPFTRRDSVRHTRSLPSSPAAEHFALRRSPWSSPGPRAGASRTPLPGPSATFVGWRGDGLGAWAVLGVTSESLCPSLRTGILERTVRAGCLHAPHPTRVRAARVRPVITSAVSHAHFTPRPSSGWGF